MRYGKPDFDTALPTKYSTAIGGYTPTAGNPTVLNRPATSFLRVLERIPGLGQFSTGPESASISGEEVFQQKAAKKSVLALTLQTRVTKIIRHEQKSLTLLTGLIGEFNDWAVQLSSNESLVMVSEFALLLQTQKLVDHRLVQRLDKLKLYLAQVHERERKLDELLTTQAKLLKQIKDSQSKYGVNASHTHLLQELLEENIYNKEVVEMQLSRLITTNLKEAFNDYALCSQYCTNDIVSAVNKFFDRVAVFENDLPKKLLPVGALDIYGSRRELSRKNSPEVSPSRIADPGVTNENHLAREHTPYTLGGPEDRYGGQLETGNERWGSS